MSPTTINPPLRALREIILQTDQKVHAEPAKKKRKDRRDGLEWISQTTINPPLRALREIILQTDQKVHAEPAKKKTQRSQRRIGMDITNNHQSPFACFASPLRPLREITF